MPSRAEQITQAVVAALTTPALSSVPAAQVYRDLDRAIDANVAAALVVESGDEPAPNLATLGIAYRVLDIRVTALAKGASPATLADAPMLEAYGRIMADRTLGGLAMDITEGDTQRQTNVLETGLAAAARIYRIQYRTAATALE